MVLSNITEIYLKLRFLPLFLGIFVLTPEGILFCGLIIYLLYRYKIARTIIFSCIILFYIICFLLAAWHYRAPWGWKRYVDLKGRYSFAYPSRLILTRCGNGEVVVAKIRFKDCLDPRNAPREYIDNLYLQTFLPRKMELADYIAVTDSSNNLSMHLKGWNMIDWHENDWALFTTYRRMDSEFSPSYPLSELPSFTYWDTPAGRMLKTLLFAREKENNEKIVFPERFAIGRTAKNYEEQKEFNILLETVYFF